MLRYQSENEHTVLYEVEYQHTHTHALKKRTYTTLKSTPRNKKLVANCREELYICFLTTADT